MKAKVFVGLVWLLCSWVLVAAPTRRAASEESSTANEAARHFDEVVAPLIARRCLDCHNPADLKGGLDLTAAEKAFAGGDSGTAIEPRAADKSLLWARIDADEMPPKHPLPPAERKVLRDWIDNGAVWGSGEIDRFRYSTETRAGYDWWSLQPLARPAVPAMPEDQWSRNAIDRFVYGELRRRDLQPSREADRRTLIRRLSFDLVGLPPEPEEVAAFVADERPDAYERVVERLLASPQYGVRWARHWLDVVRFGESNGFEFDEFRQNAWPYRDWVVRALNDDLPYDEFARLQIAGDVVRPGQLDAAIATGFLAAGAYDTAGQGQQSAAMRAVVRQDEMEDLVGTVSQTFLALTVNCARCHDHKFDPIRQKEYYGLVAALSGVRQGNRELTGLEPTAARAEQGATSRSRHAELSGELAILEQPVREQILSQRSQPQADLRPLAAWDFARGVEGQPAGWELALHGSARITADGLALDGETAYATCGTLLKELRAKTLEAWVRLANVEQRGGAVLGVQSLDGTEFDAMVFGEREPRRWLAGSENFVRTRSFSGPDETETNDTAIHVCITYADDGTITAYRDGRPYGQAYRASGIATFAAGQTQVVFGLRHSPAGPGKLLAGTIERARLYDRALTAEEVAASSGRHVTSAMIRAKLAPDQRARFDALHEELARLAALIAVLQPSQVYAIKPRAPEPTRLLERGDPAKPKDVISPCGIGSLSALPADFGLAPDGAEGERRQRLAAWITDARNPLFARVIVNRLWHYHFGTGLVDTPNDFGFNGGRPSNRALLDWLAAELVASGYRLKAIHRLIVTSAAYRQGSRYAAAAAQVDADNRLLWRKTPQRLEAEAVRDCMLQVAGVLDLAMDGPGFQEMKISIAPGTNTYLYAPDDPTRAIFKRRTLYRVWARSGRSALLDVFDCPDPSTTSPRRAVTTTPLQALALLNNPFVLHVADKLAERVAREAGSEPTNQVARAYQLAYGRLPRDDERDAASRIVSQRGLGVLTRALLNSNEFLYVD
ncbi:MAG: DUF1553 domain-containing protein [Planctomycetia bacterium]|nr:DUF1553 domain-containing protein [Planctomycetia bacterium]